MLYIYLHRPVYIFAHRAALLLNMQNIFFYFFIFFTFIIYYYNFFPLCVHILFFDDAKCSIKQHSHSCVFIDTFFLLSTE